MDTVTKGETKYALYAVSMFFVEVPYDAKDNWITGINSFVGGETLNMYRNVPKKFQLAQRKMNSCCSYPASLANSKKMNLIGNYY